MGGIEVVVADAGEYLDQAGRIWAEATAARDGDSDLPPVDAARAVIEQAVRSSARSLLLIARGQDDEALGFAASVQLEPEHARRAELRYLGVRPRAWGDGIAARLLAALRDALRSRGFAEGELWVYCDNHRAIDLYRRMQWQPSPDIRTHPRSGRRERRYTLALDSNSPLPG